MGRYGKERRISGIVRRNINIYIRKKVQEHLYSQIKDTWGNFGQLASSVEKEFQYLGDIEYEYSPEKELESLFKYCIYQEFILHSFD